MTIIPVEINLPVDNNLFTECHLKRTNLFNSSGPVQFPSPPTDGPVESSGVIVGASGYGFVPPNGPSSKL